MNGPAWPWRQDSGSTRRRGSAYRHSPVHASGHGANISVEPRQERSKSRRYEHSTTLEVLTRLWSTRCPGDLPRLTCRGIPQFFRTWASRTGTTLRRPADATSGSGRRDEGAASPRRRCGCRARTARRIGAPGWVLSHHHGAARSSSSRAAASVATDGPTTKCPATAAGSGGPLTPAAPRKHEVATAWGAARESTAAAVSPLGEVGRPRLPRSWHGHGPGVPSKFALERAGGLMW